MALTVIDKSSIHFNVLTLKPVQLPTFWVQIEGQVVRAVLDTCAQHRFLSEALVQKYFYYKTSTIRRHRCFGR